MAIPVGTDTAKIPSRNSSPNLVTKSKFISSDPQLDVELQSISPEPKTESEHKSRLPIPKPDDTDTKVDSKAKSALAELIPTNSILDRKDIVDTEVLRQILVLDEPDDHEFSMGMAWAYFDQAKNTFQKMDKALYAEDLSTISSLGYFLKGSSAALGVAKVCESCERIQYYASLRDEETDQDLSKENALKKITRIMVQLREEYNDAEKWLRKYYEVNAPDETPPDVR